jgi:GGDEF domain-containing protein
MKEILAIIKNEIHPYTILGRLNKRIFAAHFFNYEMKNIYIWAEKLRGKVARQPISVGMRHNTYTISIGLCSTKGKTNISEVIENAELALNKAVTNGGNSVLHLN